MIKEKEIFIDNEFIDKLVELAINNGIEFEVFEGTLNDNYIFYDTKQINITDVERGNYIIVKNIFRNTWQSDLKLITTNDIEEVEHYRTLFN